MKPITKLQKWMIIIRARVLRTAFMQGQKTYVLVESGHHANDEERQMHEHLTKHPRHEHTDQTKQLFSCIPIVSSTCRSWECASSATVRPLGGGLPSRAWTLVLTKKSHSCCVFSVLPGRPLRRRSRWSRCFLDLKKCYWDSFPSVEFFSFNMWKFWTTLKTNNPAM